MKDMLKLALSLGLICLIGSAALTWVYSTTKEPINQAEQKALQANLKLVLPAEAMNIEQIAKDDDVIVFKASDDQGATVGYAAQAVGKGGFKGEIKVLVGTKPDGSIRMVIVTGHNETPGIGTRATDRKVKRSLWDVLKGVKPADTLPPNAFLDGFNGRTTVHGDNPVRAISGATYSSRTVISAVDKVCQALQNLNISPKEAE